ncbi:MAG TPA: hypothetical protein OIM35_07180 [Clostridiaceae bacterium]|nr:hypothetical protein [Clostridiaceae bacterium]
MNYSVRTRIKFLGNEANDRNRVKKFVIVLIKNKEYTKATNIDNLSSLGKLLSNNFVPTQQKNNLKAI